MRYNRPKRFSMPRLLGLCIAACCVFFLTPMLQLVHADGGAPNLAYVVGGGPGVSVIDIAQQKVTRTITLNGDPSMVYLSIDGRYLYVAQPALHQVTMLVALTGATVCSASVPGDPSLLTFDAGVNTLYVAGNDTSLITAVDGSNCKIKQTIQTNGPVYGMAIAQVGTSGENGGTGNQLWFTTTRTLNVFQLPNTIQTIAIPGGLQYVSIPPGATVYVTTHQGTVVGVSLQTQQTATLLTGGDFGPMDYDAFTSEIYVPDKKHHQVDVLTPIYYGNPTPQEPNHVISLDAQPLSVAVTSDGNLAFIALTGGHVTMYDIFGKQALNTFSVGGNPRFIITGLYPPPNPQQTTNANGSPIPTTWIYLIVSVALVILIIITILLILSRRQKATPA